MKHTQRVADRLLDRPALLFLWVVFVVKVILPVTRGMKKMELWLGINRVPR